jgi:hypothetical protein
MCYPEAVGGDLNLGKSHLFCLFNDLHQIITHGGLPSGELDGGGRDGFLGTKDCHHPDNILEIRFVHKSTCTGICKTEITVKIATVGEIDVCQQGLGMVIAAQTTGGRAAFGWSNILGIFNTGTDLFKSLEPVIECRIGPVEIFKVTVPGARATEYDLSLFFQDFRINDGIACGAKTTGFFNQHSCPPLHNSL